MTAIERGNREFERCKTTAATAADLVTARGDDDEEAIAAAMAAAGHGVRAAAWYAIAGVMGVGAAVPHLPFFVARN